MSYSGLEYIEGLRVSSKILRESDMVCGARRLSTISPDVRAFEISSPSCRTSLDKCFIAGTDVADDPAC